MPSVRRFPPPWSVEEAEPASSSATPTGRRSPASTSEEEPDLRRCTVSRSVDDFRSTLGFCAPIFTGRPRSIWCTIKAPAA